MRETQQKRNQKKYSDKLNNYEEETNANFKVPNINT